MTRVITIRLEIPDGVEVRIGGGLPDDAEEEPLPPSWIAPGQPEPPFRTIAAAHNGPTTGCPVHGVPWRTVPAGISRKTGRSYASFVACPELGCDERPSATRRTAS